jgi:hypothetical protein
MSGLRPGASRHMSSQRIYEFHVDNGVVGTAIRGIQNPTRVDGRAVRIMDGSYVAIAFDGNWYRYRSAWRMVTEEVLDLLGGCVTVSCGVSCGTTNHAFSLDTGVTSCGCHPRMAKQYSAELDRYCRW